jgi:propionate CoA-transferase
MEREALTLDAVAAALAAKNSGGFVIARVERMAAAGTLDPRKVQVQGIFVDCVVVARPDNHHQTYAVPHSAAFVGQLRVRMDRVEPMKLDEREIIARRTALELPPGGVVNLGIGMRKACRRWRRYPSSLARPARAAAALSWAKPSRA